MTFTDRATTPRHDGDSDAHPAPPDPLATAVFTVGGARRAPARTETEVGLPRRLLGGALAGLLGGLGLYAVLAVVAAGQGRGAAYPIHAVHALLSGKRVLPDHPHPALAGGQVQDSVTGLIYFFLPAIAIGLWVAYRMRGYRPDAGWLRWARSAVVPAALASGLMLVVFVIGIAGQDVDQVTQRFSSGYGIRQLGILGWLIAHVVYVAVVVATMLPATLVAARLKRERRGRRAARARSGR